jgi:hypothetical protein
MKKPLLLHPFLFALFPALFVYSQNMEQMSVQQLWPAIFLVVGATLVILLLAAVILRDALRAGAVLSLFLFLFFSYGPVYRLLWGGYLADSVVDRPLILLLAGGTVFAGGVALILRKKSGWHDFTRILNVVAFVLVLSSLFNIGLFEVRSRATGQDAGRTLSRRITAPQVMPVDVLPDIYYIILDGYARADVLQHLYNYDNTQFLDFLRRRGFYVAGRSRANYAQTALSLASSLNLCYLDDDARRIGLDSQDWEPLGELIADSAALSFLRQQGYSIVAFPTGFDRTDLTAVDVYLGRRRKVNDLEVGLLLTTPIPWLLLEDSQARAYAEHTQRIRYIFDHLPGTTELGSPHFVFAHVLAPHPPFVFGAQGNEITPARVFGLGDGSHFMAQGGTQEEYRAGYTNQLTYINHKVEAMLDELLAHSSRPTIVILQSDHGPGSQLVWDSLENTDLRERMSILNAYLLPGEEPVELYDEITPVNTFRFIFNRYFGADLELLEDRTYFSTWERPYRFVDVTDRVAAPQP